MGWYRLDLHGSRLAFTDRHGGRSAPPYDSLNLSTDQSDAPEAVAANREVAGRLVGVAPDRWVQLRQVHGTVTVVDDPSTGERVEADAVVVNEPGRAGLILTADCVPLALLGPGAVAAVHGGWRGLLEGVVGSAVETFSRVAGAPGVGVLGPCIRPCCYEFGEADLDRVADRFGDDVRATTTIGSPALDLPSVVRGALAEVGVPEMREIRVCTACSPDYFSHRRDAPESGSTGRQGLLVTRIP